MAKPKLALIPATQGSKLYSVLPADGVGDFTFSRNSAATRINKDGLIETVASGVSRLNYPLIDGVVNGCPSHLLEPQSTNLITYSEDFSNAYWTKNGLLTPTSGFVSPSGDLSAFKLVEDTANSGHFIKIRIDTSSSFLSNSIFVKAEEVTKIGISESGSTGDYASFNLSNGVLIASGGNPSFSIKEMSNDWYRISLTSASQLSRNDFNLALLSDDYVSGIPYSQAYQGDGISGILIYGAQLEAGSYATSYIPTSGSAVTRVAETANGAGDASTFNDSEGVLMVEISALSNDLTDRYIMLSDGGWNNRVQLNYENISNTLEARVFVGGLPQFDTNFVLTDTTVNNKIALKYKENDFALWVNGVEISPDFNGTVPSVNTFNELSFYDGQGSNNFYGNVKQIQYFDSALNDSDLETLTSWTSFTDLANEQTYSIK